MTIKRSMLFISGLVLLLSAISLSSLNYSLNKESELKNGQVLLAEIDAGILMLRRHEKDFLLRKNIKYQQKFTTSIEQTFQKINRLEQLLLQENAETDSIQKLSTVLKSYQASFNAMIKSYEQVGLDEKSGLQGKLRIAAHALEYEAKEANSLPLYKDLLMLRRHEKDFLLRLSTKYSDRFNQAIVTMQTTLKEANLSPLENHEISSLLAYYQTQFNTMVKGYSKAGLDSNSGLQGEMRKTVHQTDQVLKVTEKQISEELLSKVAFINMVSNVIIIAITLLVLLISILVTRRIMHAVNALKTAIHQTDTTNDFSLRSSYDAKDEIGDISRAFNQLISRLQQAIQEANSVVNAVAKGDFSQRMTSPLSGDLQSLKEGVNGSAESVECMISELEKVLQALNEGNFNVKMDENVSEEFRNKVDATLHNLHSTIGNILQVMGDVRQGNYSTRVTVEAKGDLNRLKTEVNDTIDALEKAIKDINRVVMAQQDGDLTQNITTQYPGELAVLTQAINNTNLKLLSVINDVDNTIISISGASSVVSQGAANLTEIIKEQSVAMDETSSTMEEMSTTVQNNTDNSNNIRRNICCRKRWSYSD
ncbi:MAG: methyl-accepting chemotaxis protein [Thiomicrorhabdus sp.]|nr:methyl-accepting chemotaxis protein [Thiomicrorhabdus sp.]